MTLQRQRQKRDVAVFVLLLLIGTILIVPYQRANAIDACIETVYCGDLTWCICGCAALSGKCNCQDLGGGCYVSHSSGAYDFCFC